MYTKVNAIIMGFFAIFLAVSMYFSPGNRIPLAFALLIFFIVFSLRAIFYLKNINYIFSHSNGKLIVHTPFKMRVFDLDTACARIANKEIRIFEDKTNRQVKFNSTAFDVQNFDILQRNLIKILAEFKPTVFQGQMV